MRAHLIKGDIVVNTVEVVSLDDAASIWPDLLVVEATVGSIGWLYDGTTFSPPPPVVRDPEEIKAEIVAATQQRLDSFAQSRGYDSMLSACTYATSPTPRFAAEGQYCVEARDATWSKLYEMLGEVLAGTRPMPTGFADVEPELPALSWPA